MLDFILLQLAQKQYINNLLQNTSSNKTLYFTDVSKDELWETYITTFPEENGIRQSFNCNCCRQFIKSYGNLVVIDKNNKAQSIWNFTIDDPTYKVVINKLDNLVTNSSIRDVFVTHDYKLGVDSNLDLRVNSNVIRWYHFAYELPKSYTLNRRVVINEEINSLRTSKEVFKRSLDELTIESTSTVLELIAQESLYRGEEYKGMLSAFLNYQKEYESLTNERDKDNYCWRNFKNASAVARMRNTAVGSLLIDISKGADLDEAVRKFESLMAPTNYKRPKPIISSRMIEQAETTINQLGLSPSLKRKLASVNDVPITNVLFVNRAIKKQSGLFDSLREDIPVDTKKLGKVEELTLKDFISNVLPTAINIRLLLENKHENNLVSLVAPVEKEAPTLFKWNNGFSWCYNNNVADSIREKVKAAGGKVEGLLRISLAWDTYTDLDLHVIEPSGERIYYYQKRSRYSGGELDVDMNAGFVSVTRKPVENIIYPYNNKLLPEGKYKVLVNNFRNREETKTFTVEIEYDGVVSTYNHPKTIDENETITVAEFTYSKDKGLVFTNKINSTISNSKQLWGLPTNRYHNVQMITYSPNYWNNEIGNKHVFFFLEDCQNPNPIRGIFNEFLKEELNKHKRVFEALSSKMVVEPTFNELSGVGFSTTSSGDFYIEVEGTFKRTVKVVV